MVRIRGAVSLTILGLVLSACPKSPGEAKVGAASTTRSPSRPGADVAQPSLSPRLPPETPIARWDGGSLTYGDLHTRIDNQVLRIYNQYLQELAQAEKQALDALVAEHLVKAAAKAKGQTEDAFLKEAAGTAAVSDDEVAAFYAENAAASGRSLEEMGPRIRAYLSQQRQSDGVGRTIQGLRQSANVETTLPPLEFARMSFALENRPMKGNPEAEVTIVEFSDFECPYCSRAAGAIEGIVKAMPDKVRVYFLNFPLDFHARAMPAAVAGRCAHRQGKFWELHSKMFANQSQLGEDDLTRYAEGLGVDLAAFRKCLADPAVEREVKADMAQGERAGVQGTPSFFVNGVPFTQGIPTPDALKELFPSLR